MEEGNTMKILKQNRDALGVSRRADRATQRSAPSRQMLVQPKLELTTPGDSYEREADRMADYVMRKPFGVSSISMPSTVVANQPKILRRATGSYSDIAVDSATESGIHASRGGGQPLPTDLRARMESGFGTDFSGVRLHTGSAAETMSSNLNAKAFTYGNNIYFNRGQYSPNTTAGQHLIAHELTHVVQQSGKVGRIPIDGEYNPFFSEFLEQKRLAELKEAETTLEMTNFILESQWVKEKVLGEYLFNKLKWNYLKEERSTQKPVVIVVLTSHAAACQGNVSGKCAFEEVEPGILWNTIKGPISSLLENSGDKRVLMIQAPRSNQDLIDKIKKISRDYGLIKDIVFRGHGNSNIISLNKGYNITTINSTPSRDSSLLISTIVQEMDKNRPNAIIFAGCLTDADSNISSGLSQSVRHYLKIHHPNLNTNVQGNEASVSTEDQILSYEEENLKLANTKATSAPNSTGERRNYRDCEDTGILWNMIGKLDPNTKVLYDDANILQYCDSGNIEDISIKKTITTTTGTSRDVNLIIRTRALINFVNNNRQGQNTPLISQSDMLIFLHKIAEKHSAVFAASRKISTIKNGEIIIEYNDIQKLYNATINQTTGSNNNRTQR